MNKDWKFEFAGVEKGVKFTKGNCGVESNFRGFSGNQLKVFAIIAMAADHLAWTIWPGYENKAWWLILIHLFGRLAAPTMWFMIAEGYQHTRNLKKYLLETVRNFV